MTGKRDKSINGPVIWQTGRHTLANKRHGRYVQGDIMTYINDITAT
jgi:hypothetical protein